MTLRPYQNEGIRHLFAALHKHRSVIYQSPTGSGKTHVAVAIIKKGLEHGRRINFYTSRIALIDQTFDVFTENGIDCGVVQANHPARKLHAPVQLISPQTLNRRDEAQWPAADLHIVDEAHDQFSCIYDVMAKWPDSKYIGLTATPFTKGLGLKWETLVVGATTSKLMSDGYLCQYEAYAPSAPDMKGARTRHGDYLEADAAERMNVLTGSILDHWVRHGEGRKTIGFAVNVAHAKELAATFQQAGIAAEYVCGMDEPERRKAVMAGFKDGSIRVLFNVAVLTTGFDAPDIGCMIVARPTKSLSLHIQILGRGLRVSDGKDHVLILDHAGNLGRMGLPDEDLPTTLDMSVKGESKDSPPPKEALPWTCPACYKVNQPKTYPCPCGFAPKGRSEVVETKDQLVKVGKSTQKQRAVVFAKAGVPDAATFFAMLNGVQRQRNFKSSFPVAVYKQTMGVWPRNIDTSAVMKPTPEFDHWVNGRLAHNAIKRSKAK